MDSSEARSKVELEQRVRALSDAINLAKENRSAGPSHGYQNPRRAAPYHYGSAHSKPYHPRPGHHRGSYTHFPAAGGPHRNRTLVIQQPYQPKNENQLSQVNSANQEPGHWVSKRDRHMQLINKSVYDKMVEERSNGNADPGGDTASSTNLPTSISSSAHHRGAASGPKSVKAAVTKTELCRTFSSTGQCRKGPSCKFIHDPAKVAICKEFLSKGTCHLGTSCNLSHEPNPHRVPACIHFLRGNCTNSQCRYAHVNVNPNAPICAAFANIGYCEKGASCLERHEFECPDYALKGSCGNSRCRLPHIDRAGQLRKVANPGQFSNTGHADDPTPMDISHEQVGPSVAANVAGFPTAEAATAAPSEKNQAPNGTGSEVFSEQENFLSLDVDPEGDFEEMFRSSSEEKGS